MESETSDPGVTAEASPSSPDVRDYMRQADAADTRAAAVDVPAASSPAAPAVQAASTDASTEAAPAAAPPSGQKNLKTRGPELDAEIAGLQEKLKIRKALREELASLERPAHVPPASAPAAEPQKAAWERYKLLPNAPSADQFDTYEDFLDARADFIVEQRFQERDRRAALDRESQQRQSETGETITSFRQRIAKARESDPDFEAKVDPGLLEIVPAFSLLAHEPVRPAHVLMQQCVESEAGPALLLHFSTPAGHQEWSNLLSATTPARMIQQFGRIEARFLSTDGTSAGASAAPASSVTKAPAPPTTLGGKPPVSPDRAGAAAKAGDFRAYQAAQDAADLAQVRR